MINPVKQKKKVLGFGDCEYFSDIFDDIATLEHHRCPDYIPSKFSQDPTYIKIECSDYDLWVCDNCNRAKIGREKSD